MKKMNNFFLEFQKLLLEKPRYNVKQVNSENCEYADTAVKSKNCYYSFCVFYCEDVYYARYSRKCTSCSDVTFCVDCQWCKECTDCKNCYMTDYSQDCANCSDSAYCKDCYSCEYCFGCVGINHKKYHIFNKPYTKEQYVEYVGKLDLGNEKSREIITKKRKELEKEVAQLGIHKVQTENCTGDQLSQCKNCYQCYDIFASEDCLYNIECNGNTDSVDMTVCFEAEECYQCIQAPINYNCNFLLHTDMCNDSEFCAYSKDLKNCFGCVYLRHKEYHILNKPYSKEKYFEKVAEIKKNLKENHQYNLGLYFISEYEQSRVTDEQDSSIQTDPPILTT